VTFATSSDDRAGVGFRAPLFSGVRRWHRDRRIGVDAVEFVCWFLVWDAGDGGEPAD